MKPGDPDVFDYIVVGSGFGGAITACRLAEIPSRVLLLERGQPYPPGSFPRTPRQVRRAFWAPDDQLYGIYDVWSFKHLDVVCSSGLGGGSLIYANVLLPKDPGDWQREGWPIESKQLEPYYARVQRMIRPAPCPAPVPKALAIDAAAAELRRSVERPALAVRFARDGAQPGSARPYASVHGAVVRSTCRMCGACDVGCNFGAKQTLDFTYLTRANAAGAQIRTCCEVRTIESAGGSAYLVGYRQHLQARAGHPAHLLDESEQAERSVYATRGLVLAAGAVGTPRLLLANRAGLPRLSPALGTRVSANGDAIAWVRRARANGAPSDLDPSNGPVITRSIPFEAQTPGGSRRFRIQDAGAPVLGDWLWEGFEVPGVPWRMRRIALRRLRERLRGRRDARFGRVLATAISDEPEAVLPLLAMGLDEPDGRYVMEDGRLELDWRPEPSDPYYDAVEAGFEEVAEALGGQLTHFPPRFLHRTTTVHPLGGCPMADDPRRGVVAPDGHVFGTEGLYVADGSAMPGPIGANPSFTIAAFAELVGDAIREAGARPGRP